MNAASRTLVTRTAAASARSMSTAAVPRPSFIPPQPSFSKVWLSDITTYPIMGLILCANIGWTSFISYKFTHCPNVRFTSKTRGKVIRDWN